MAAAKHSGLDRAVLVIFRQALLVEINCSNARWVIGKAAVAELDRSVGPPVRHRSGHRHSRGEEMSAAGRYGWRVRPFHAGEISVGPRVGASREPAFTAAADMRIQYNEIFSDCVGRNQPYPNQCCADDARPQQPDPT